MIHTILNKKVLILITVLLIIIVGILVFYPREIFEKDDGSKKVEVDKKKDKKGVKTKGWLRIQGTNIDHPVIYYTDENSKYINRNKYVWDTNKKEEIYNHVIITGHNILNLSSRPRINDNKFNYAEDLMSFVYPEFIKKNKYIQYTVGGKEYIYKIYAARFIKDHDTDMVSNSNIPDEEIISYSDMVKKSSIYKTNVKIKPYDGLISIVTCTRFFGDEYRSVFIVEGRLVRAGERLVNYPVYTTDNYKKIKKYMKGDVEDV
ncbi:MAG: class B sortase [Bacilli bacterium]|nr:class B sortase [Bacilli bacterium]